MNTRSSPRDPTTRSLARVAVAILVSQFAWPRLGYAQQVDGVPAETTDTQAYAWTELHAPDNGLNLSVSSINARGQVVGDYQPYGYVCRFDCPRVGFIYSAGAWTTLDPPDAHITYPVSINNRGQVAGLWCRDIQECYGVYQSFIYSAGVFTILNVPGAYSTSATGLNNNGQVTGSYNRSDISTHGAHGFLYSAGTFEPLDVPDSDSTQPTSINDRGQVAGSYYISNNSEEATGWHGFVYSAGSYTTLDAPGAVSTLASSLNNNGQVTGSYEGIDQATHGFIYSASVLTTLDVPGAESTHPTSINNGGQVTGYYTINNVAGATETHGFVYTNGSFTYLDVPGAAYKYTSPSTINACGQVAGLGNGSGGFIATPVVAMLDQFNRNSGKLGPNWNGSVHLTDYRIVNQRIRVRSGGPIYWHANPFGLDQEAFVTLTKVDPTGIEQGLLLKVQGQAADYRKGAIVVKYDASTSVVRVSTWRKSRSSWRRYRDIPLALASGDNLGARVLSNGKVKIFQNGQVVGRINLGFSDQKFFNSKIGRIGLWFENAPNAILDDFGGGTNMP